MLRTFLMSFISLSKYRTNIVLALFTKHEYENIGDYSNTILNFL